MGSRTWDLTLNNPTDEDIATLKTWENDVTRMTISQEKGENGTPHLQGRITFKRVYRLNAVKKLIPKAHWEPTKCDQDTLYCLKAGSVPIININNKNQGKRTDLDDAIEAIKNGITTEDLWKNHSKTMVRYSNGLLQLRTQLTPQIVTAKYQLKDFPKWKPITDWTKSHVLWGEAGIGKTQFALAHFQRPFFVTHIDQLIDFNSNYDGIVFDDMSFEHIPRESQIHLVDIDQPRSIHCRYKTANIPANTKKIFTTNHKLGLIFDLRDAAIHRRVTVTEVTDR